MLEKLKDYKFELLLSLYIIFTIVFQFIILNSSQYASGTDGYYYAYQVLSMRKKGAFSLPESSITIYYLYFFSLIIKNIILSNKIAVSILKGLCVLGFYLNVKNLFDKRTGIIVSIAVSSSLMINYFTSEYIKLLGGIVVFLFFLNSLIVLNNKPGRKEYAAAIALFFASVFTHKAIAVFSVIVVFFYLITRIKPLCAFIIIIGSILFLLFVSLIIPNSLHYLDFIRFRNYFSFTPALPIFIFFESGNLCMISRIEAVFYFTAPLLVFPFVILKQKENRFIFISLYLVFFLLINPFVKEDSYNTAFRLFILIFIQTAFCIAFLVSKIKSGYILTVIVLLIPLHIFNTKNVYIHHQHNYELYSDIIPLLNLPQNSLLIVHQGFDYLYWFETGKKAFHYLPEEKHMNRPLYRLAFGIRKDIFEKYALPDAEIIYLPGFYSLIEEKDWQHFIKQAPGYIKNPALNWKNPHTHREKFLLRNQKFR